MTPTTPRTLAIATATTLAAALVAGTVSLPAEAAHRSSAESAASAASAGRRGQLLVTEPARP